MLASEEEDNAKHGVQGRRERRKEAQCIQHAVADQEDKAAGGCGIGGRPIMGVGCAISGTSILGAEEPQAAVADQEDKTARGCGIVGRPILGVGRAISGTSILGTPEIERDLRCGDREGKADTHAECRAMSGTSILGVGVLFLARLCWERRK